MKIRVRINIKGQAKAVVPDVTVELDGSEDKIDVEQSQSALEEAKRIYDEAEKYCMVKMK